jgi:outer membrane receptor protein involved in Fe transport
VVTARRSPQDPFASDREISVVDRVLLRSLAPRTVPEALWESPGVFVQQTSHGGGSPILRGLVGPQVLILVDGIRLNNSVYRTGPGQYLNLIDPLAIDRIEVLRGPGSVLYGSDAMGGVIQVFPTEPRSFASGLGHDGRLVGRYASANEAGTLHARLELGSGGLGGLGSFTFNTMQDLEGGRGVGVQRYSGYEQFSASGQLAYRFGRGAMDGWSVKLGYLMGRIYGAGRTDQLLTKRSLQLYDNEDDLLWARLSMRLPRLKTDGKLSLSYQHFHELKDGQTLAEDLVTEIQTTRDQTKVHTGGVDLQLRTRLWDRWLQLLWGGMWYLDSVSASRWHRLAGEAFTRMAQQPYPDGSTYQNWGAFALLEASLVPPRYKSQVRLGAGYRLHGMKSEAPSQPDLPAVDFSRIGHVTFASVRYLYRETATLGVTFSQGFRAPNLFEAVMMGDSGQFFHVPNPSLGPERSDTLELLMRGRFGRAELGFSAYVSWIHDLMKREFTTWQGEETVGGKPVTINVNVGEGFILGMEASLRLQLWRGLSLGGHVTHTWGEERVEGGMNVPLRLVPPLFGVAVLRYQAPRIGRILGFAEASVRGAGRQSRLSPEDQNDSRIPQGGTPAWWTLNLRLGAQIGPHLRVLLAAENLLDRKYKYHGSGVYAPGTNVILQLEGTI